MGFGIDFGSTNSVFLFMDPHSGNNPGKNGIYHTGGNGNDPTPSVAWVNRMVADDHPQRHVWGQNPSNPNAYFRMPNLKWHLGFRPKFNHDGQAFDAQPLVTGYLKHLFNRLIAGEAFRKAYNTKNEVVASVPVTFGPGYRGRLRTCLENAGFGNVRLVYEPTAAAIACLDNSGALAKSSDMRGPILVMDWGGGTVDISLIEFKENGEIIDIHNTGIANGLGGIAMDLDLAFRGSTEEAFAAIQGMNNDKRTKLLAAIEAYKLRAIHCLDNGIPCPDSDQTIVDGAGNAHTILLTEANVKECVTRFCGKIHATALAMVGQAGLSPEDVKHKIMVGGPFRSNHVKLHKAFNDWNAELLECDLSSQIATALGCAILADRGYQIRLATDVVVYQSGGDYYRIARHREGFPTDSNPSRICQGVRFTMQDLTATEAIFQIGRMAGPRQSDNDYACLKYVPFPTPLSVPVCHSMMEGAPPFCPSLDAHLDRDLTLTIEATGRLGNLHAAAELNPTDRMHLDCLPLLIQMEPTPA
jgi:molecular chaperone DnaK (HSP70)